MIDNPQPPSGESRNAQDSDGSESSSNSGTHVPSRFAGHQLIHGRYFFTLPTELLEDVVEKVGEDHFDPSLLDMERTLSGVMGDHSAEIGFRAGVPIRYGLLGRILKPECFTTSITPDMEKRLGWKFTPNQLAALGAADERLEADRVIARAYCGWLCLNEQFLTEQSEFIDRWSMMAKQFGLVALTPHSNDPARLKAVEYTEFTDARDRFLRRWQLTELSGPFLPTPPMRHAPAAGGVIGIVRNPDLGTLFFFPSVYPLPDRQELSRMIDAAIGSQKLPPHLKEWADVIATDNPGRSRAFPRLSRIFLLQHFWRVLRSRHGPILASHVGKLHQAFADFLQLPGQELEDSGRVIKEHLSDLNRIRGTSWDQTPSPLEL